MSLHCFSFHVHFGTVICDEFNPQVLTICYLDSSAAAQNQLQKHFGTMLISTYTYLLFSLYDVLLSFWCVEINHKEKEKNCSEIVCSNSQLFKQLFNRFSIQVPNPWFFYYFDYTSGIMLFLLLPGSTK